MTTPISGGCLCGGVRFTVRTLGFGIINCHCEDCRILHGNYKAMVVVASQDLQFESDATLTRYRTSAEAQRGFCHTCGAQLFKLPDDGQMVLVSAGALKAPLGLQTRKNVWVEDAPDWYTIPSEKGA